MRADVGERERALAGLSLPSWSRRPSGRRRSRRAGGIRRSPTGMILAEAHTAQRAPPARAGADGAARPDCRLPAGPRRDPPPRTRPVERCWTGRSGGMGSGWRRLRRGWPVRLSAREGTLTTISSEGSARPHGRFSRRSSSGPEYAKLRIRLIPGSSRRGPTPQMKASSYIGMWVSRSWRMPWI